MDNTLRKKILKEISFLQKQNLNNLNYSDEDLFYQLSESLNKLLLKEDEAENAQKIIGKLISRWKSGKMSDESFAGQLRQATGEGLTSSTPKADKLFQKLFKVKNTASVEELTSIANNSFVSQASATGSAAKAGESTSVAKTSTSAEGGLVKTASAESGAASAKGGAASAESGLAKTASAEGAIAKTTATEVSQAIKEPGKFVQLLERFRPKNLPIDKYIERFKALGSSPVLQTAGKVLAVLGAAAYIYEIQQNGFKNISAEGHVFGMSSVAEVGSIVVAKLAPELTVAGITGAGGGAAAASAVLGAVAAGAAVGGLIGMGINKIGEWRANAVKNEEKGEIVNAKGQQAVALMQQYCKGGFDRGTMTSSTGAAVGKAIGTTLARIGTLGLSAGSEVSKGDQTPGMWSGEDADDMIILFGNIFYDPSIPVETKKQLAKCFAPLSGSPVGEALRRKGFILTDEGAVVFSAEDIANLLNENPPPDAAPKTPPTEPPSDSGEFGKAGKSFTCKGDTADSSIVAKFQRYVGTTPDGQFGRNTYNTAVKKGINFGSTWEEYSKTPTGASNLCNWLKTSGQPWENQEEKIKKNVIKKKTEPTPTSPENPPEQYNPPPAGTGGLASRAGAGALDSDNIYEESYNFYDKLKVDNAKLIYERLFKIYIDGEK